MQCGVHENTTDSLKKGFRIANICKSLSFFFAQICTTPSCTCADFKKNGCKVFCKHIIFILVVVLGVSQEILKESRYIGDDDLKKYFRNRSATVFCCLRKKIWEKTNTIWKKYFKTIQDTTRNKKQNYITKNWEMPNAKEVVVTTYISQESYVWR